MNHVAFAATYPAGRKKRAGFSPAIRIGFWICIVIAAAAVIRRVVALALPAQSGPPQVVALDAWFASHAALTLAHILPALAFVLLMPTLYLERSSSKARIERLLFPLGIIVGVTAYAMTRDSIGGWLERSAVLFFNTLFLFFLVRAWRFRTSDPVLKLRWMTRAIGILLGIATTRPVMGVFFATSRLTHLSPSHFLGIAFWIGFSVNTVIVEIWVRSQAGQAELQRLVRRPA